MEDKAREDKSLLKEPLPTAEEKILSFWKEIDLLNQIENKKKPKKLFAKSKEFIFYEGPPTANGRPGIHHLLARAFKDVVLRYKTMQGFYVRRRGGWDTHGLPVELQVEKELGLKSKKEIETYGIAPFNEKCQESVWTYVEEWERFTDRIGYMLDQKNAYVTYKPEYIESVWNIISKVAEQNLLYKDYKVVPWCPRCGTALSSHELAQGYQDDKDLSVYIKFPVVGEPNTYFLAWTTTPWTLPGHVALAVGEKISYVKVKQGEEFFILAESRTNVLPEGFEVVEKILGKDLVGKKYLPPFDYLEKNIPDSEKSKLSKAFQVYEADFVNTEDGTGIVHTAVMYGQDDFVFGTKIGLPKYHLVDEAGYFVRGTGFLEGRFVKEVNENGKPTLAVDIIEDLKNRNLFFKQENVTHSYPHCWRCQTPLIYYARDSWYIAMSKLREKLISENKKINWEPEYIKDGRFGEWLSDVKDWAISRERYWGTPLPIWEEPSGERIIVDSVETLKKYTKKSGNKYFGMRHGQAEHNVSYTCSSTQEFPNHLTDKGKKDVLESVRLLKNKKITKIISSPFVRTKETAELVAKEIGYPVNEIIFDDRIREYGFGEFDQKPRSLYDEWRKVNNTIEAKPVGGESIIEAKKRVAEFLYDLEKHYSEEVILFISHGIVFEVLPSIINGYDKKVTWGKWEQNNLPYGQVSEFSFIPIPHDKNFELDLHKPFIDEVVLVKNSPAGEGKEFRRVKEVMDVWLDSGAMPFAQDHYPFENKKFIEKGGFPADYICEAIDQTRGWFYTLHAIGNLMGRGRAFKNVICLGHILDKDGKKMSKSVGNVVDPWIAMNEFGADPIRMWMFAVKEPGESKNFDPESVKDLSRKVFGLLSNVYTFYETYGEKVKASNLSKNILDRWVIARLNETNEIITKRMDEYRVVEPARAIRDFIGDFSQWYIRRSRERFKENDLDASKTTRFVLNNVARFMAPFSPFYAEMLWRDIREENEPISVHLMDWPKISNVDKKLISQMSEVRELVSKALELRSRANIKIRQPLKELRIKNKELGLEFFEIIKEELNVKEIIFDEKISDDLVLDTNITHGLQIEGDMRELIRAIQEKRKELGLTPKDFVKVVVKNNPEKNKDISSFASTIKKQGNIKELIFEEGEWGVDVMRV